MSGPAEALPPPSPPAKHPSSPVTGLSAPPSPNHNNTPLVVENPDEDDLGISLDCESDTASLGSSVLRYREENGRTYHAYMDGAYFLPNDTDENERLDCQHVIFLWTFDGKLYCAPLTEESPRVLDVVEPPSGAWILVTGVDLSPIQPEFVPQNAAFFVDDIEDDWTYSRPFDFIFSRFLTGSIKDWPKFFKQSFEYLNHGGYIELQDIIFPVASDDHTLPEDSALRKWSELLTDAFRDMGRPIDSAYSYEQQLSEAGFVDFQVTREMWPTNHWPRLKKYKQLGIWNLENILSGLSAFSLAVFTRPRSENGLGWSREELEVLLADVRKDLRNTGIHAYFPVRVVYARKP